MTKMIDPTSREFLQALQDSSIGSQISAELDSARLANRRAVAEELAALNKNVERAWPDLAKEVEKTAAAVKKAEQALLEARRKHGAAVGARTSASANYSHRRNELEAELVKSASPLLADFFARMRDEQERTRKALRTHSFTETHAVTGAKTEKSNSNGDRVRARLAAIAAAIETAQDASLIENQSGVPDLLARLEAALPSVEEI